MPYDAVLLLHKGMDELVEIKDKLKEDELLAKRDTAHGVSRCDCIVP